jgi:hypothetical protein
MDPCSSHAEDDRDSSGNKSTGETRNSRLSLPSAAQRHCRRRYRESEARTPSDPVSLQLFSDRTPQAAKPGPTVVPTPHAVPPPSEQQQQATTPVARAPSRGSRTTPKGSVADVLGKVSPQVPPPAAPVPEAVDAPPERTGAAGTLSLSLGLPAAAPLASHRTLSADTEPMASAPPPRDRLVATLSLECVDSLPPGRRALLMGCVGVAGRSRRRCRRRSMRC